MYSWERIDVSSLSSNLRLLPRFFRLRPNSGYVWLDLVFLAILVAFQFSVLPSLFGPYFGIDLITPWLFVSFLRQDFGRGLLLMSVAAFLIEGHSDIPAGFYFCAYGMILAVVTHLKDPISWAHQTPWFVGIIIAVLWVSGFEFFIYTLVKNSSEIDSELILTGMLRAALSTLLGVFLTLSEVERWKQKV